MKTRTVASIAVIFTVVALMPASLSAQIGVGVKIGTVGLGPEVSVAATNNVALRAGIGFIPIEPKRTFSDIDYTLHPPSSVWHVGVDVYPGLGSLHFSGGLLHWPQYELLATQTGSTTIGGQTYSGTINLDADVSNANQTAPYLAIGVGRLTKRGFGLFMDLGVAFIGEANIELTGTCTLSNGNPCPGSFQSDLEDEEADAEADVGRYLELLPILQIGVRIGLGR